MVKIVHCLAFIAMLTLVHSYSMDKLKLLSGSQSAFSKDLFKNIYELHRNENILISPYSVYRFLTLVYLASDGKTSKSLERALHLNWANGDKDKVYEAYLSDVEIRATDKKLEYGELSIADRLYISEDVTVEADFQAKFGGIIEKLNLAGDPGACRAHINEFIANTTNNHLTDVLSENDIGQYTNFVVANAAYFQADWMFPFPAEMTAQATFNGLSGKFDVQMMNQEDTFLFGYSEKVDAHILGLMYDELDGDIEMYILLPKSQVPSQDVLDRLIRDMSIYRLNDLTKDLHGQEVSIQIPKMALKGSYALSEVFRNMQIDHLLGGDGDFSAVSKDASLFFEEIMHVTRMEVDENGSTASAATYDTYRGEVEQFVCDRPFVFTVYDKVLGQVLFTGVYSNPSKNE